ncbi:hypothetical protein GZH53_00340, partial [Flavihumibacter sp. R14]|nr:hypothetical protein [Flavihumibacter soli]
ELHFAEINFSTAGSRVFNLNVENGEFALQNIDLFKNYGGSFTASVITASNVQVSDGLLSVNLSNVVNNAKISGIAVFLQSASGGNQAPTANAGPDKTITLPASSTVLNGSGSDPEDGTAVTFSWTQVSGPSTASFSNAAIASPTVSNLTAGTYVFSLTVKDKQLLSSPADLVSVTVNPAAGVQQLVSFTLVNASNEQDIQVIGPNAVLNLATLPSQSLNIRANTNPAIVGRVVLALSGAQTVNRTETGSPYTLFGDSNGNYDSWTPAVGSYTLTGTPYTSSSGGTAGTPLTVSFSVINQANQPPVVTKPPNASVVSGQNFNYQVVANDPEGTALTYSATNLPSGLTINSSTGLISGTVSAAAGAFTVGISVKDAQNLTSTTSFILTVNNPNQPPVVTTPPNATVVQGQAFNYQVIANDPEGTALTYSASNLPAGLTINSATGLISGTVSGSPATYSVSLSVRDQPGLITNSSFS